MQTRNCQNCKQDFNVEPDDFSFYKKVGVPAPTFCPSCRLQRRLAYINERTLFRRPCSSCGKSIVSIYSEEGSYRAFCDVCYNSELRDEYEFGVEYDFSKPFFLQFDQLFKKAPHRALVHKDNNAEGCEYANYTYKSKNTYLSFSVVGSEEIYYSKQVMKRNKICLDSMNILANERGYELIESSGNYNCRFLVRSSQCVESMFLFNCKNCTDCCLSSNLQNKSYVFRNRQLTREKYMEAVRTLMLDSHSGQETAKEEFKIISQNAICRFALIKNCVDSTGNFMEDCKNVKHSFNVVTSEDSKYVYLQVNKMSSSYDMFYTGKMELCYEVSNGGAVDYHVLFSLDIGNSKDAYYNNSCNSCSNIFGCVGLYGKEYCILNRQYTKEEYETLVPQIIEHMNEMPYVDKKGRIYKYGEYFPTDLSPFPYNESLAYEEFPLAKYEVEQEGYIWSDHQEKYADSTIQSNSLPESIAEVDDSIVKETIACPNKGDVKVQCTFGYRIHPEELRFYRLMNIPVPRYCPNCRYYQRLYWKLPWKLWHRTCMCDLSTHSHKGKCLNEFETAYAPDRPERVYCEKCYQQEVI